MTLQRFILLVQIGCLETLNRRVEVAFPVDNPDLKKRIVKILDITLNDTIKARVAQNDGTYRRKDKRGKELISSQMEFYKMEKKRNDSFFAESKKDVFIPNKGRIKIKAIKDFSLIAFILLI